MSSVLTRSGLVSGSSKSFASKVQTLCSFTPMAPFTSVSLLARKHARTTSSSLAPVSIRFVSSTPSSSTTASTSSASAAVPGNGPVRPIERPISPHVTIYAFPVAALSSITNRATGVALSVGIVGASFAALGGACDIPTYTAALQLNAPFIVPVLKFGFAFPLTYHYLAGLRHIYWDTTAKALDIKSVEVSSQALFGAAGVLSVILAFVSL